MSCQETCIGQVEEISIEQIDSMLESLGKTPDKIKLMDPDDKVSYLYDHDKNILYVNNRFFEYTNKEKYTDEPDVYYMSQPETHGPIKMSYVVSFYNGGTCLPEILEELIQNKLK